MLLHGLIPINPTIQRDRTGEHKKDRKLQIAASLGQKQDSRNPSESMNLALPRPFLKQKGPLPTGHCELLSLFHWQNSSYCNCIWDKVSCDTFFGTVLQLAGRPQFPVLGNRLRHEELQYQNIYRVIYQEIWYGNIQGECQ